MERRDFLGTLGATVLEALVPSAHAAEPKGKNPTPQHVDDPVAPGKPASGAEIPGSGIRVDPNLDPARAKKALRDEAVCKRSKVWVAECGSPPSPDEGPAKGTLKKEFQDKAPPKKQSPKASASAISAPIDPDMCSALTPAQQRKSPICTPVKPPSR